MSTKIKSEWSMADKETTQVSAMKLHASAEANLMRWKSGATVQTNTNKLEWRKWLHMKPIEYS